MWVRVYIPHGTAYPRHVARELREIRASRDGVEYRAAGHSLTCASGVGSPYSGHRHSMEPLPDNQRPENEEPDIAGIIQPSSRGRRAFRPDAEAPPLDREALTALWAKQINDPVVRRMLIANVLRYRAWFNAFLDVVHDDIARTQNFTPRSTDEAVEGEA